MLLSWLVGLGGVMVGAPPAVLLATGDQHPELGGPIISAFAESINDRGQVLLSGEFERSGFPAPFVALWEDGQVEIIMRAGDQLPDGRVIRELIPTALLHSGAFLVVARPEESLYPVVFRFDASGQRELVFDCVDLSAQPQAEAFCLGLGGLHHDEAGNLLGLQGGTQTPLYYDRTRGAFEPASGLADDAPLPGAPSGETVLRELSAALDGQGGVYVSLEVQGYHLISDTPWTYPVIVHRTLPGGTPTILDVAGSSLGGFDQANCYVSRLRELGSVGPEGVLVIGEATYRPTVPSFDCTRETNAWILGASVIPMEVPASLDVNSQRGLLVNSPSHRVMNGLDCPSDCFHVSYLRTGSQYTPWLTVDEALPSPYGPLALWLPPFIASSSQGDLVLELALSNFETAVARYSDGGLLEPILNANDLLEVRGVQRTVNAAALADNRSPFLERARWPSASYVNAEKVAVLNVWYTMLEAGGRGYAALITAEPGPESFIVNHTGDASQTGSDAACDTGATIANGDPECTLRAAIELANRRGREADIGFDLPEGSVISPSSALPMIGVDVRIHADAAANITVDGSNAGAADGLLVVDARLELEGLGLRNFGGDCVQAAAPSGVKLSGVSLETCGGIGVFNADGSVELGALGVRRSVVSGNTGGGVVARGERGQDPLVRVRDTTVELNGPVGVASSEDIWLSNVTVQGHEGPGVLADLAETSVAVRPAIYFEEGEGSTIARNDGVGVGGFGAVVAGQPVEIEENASWGVAAGRLVIGSDQNPHARRSRIQGNGRGPVCRTVELGAEGRPEVFTDEACAAGGAWLSGSFTAGESLLFDVDVSENAGPGVFSHHRVDLGRFTLTNNEGEGLIVENVGGGVLEASIVIYDFSEGEPSVISGNQSVGLESRFGGITISSRISVVDNAGWGIFSNTTVNMGAELTPPPSPNVISRNGLGTTCVKWWSDDPVNPPSRRELPCRGGGIAALSPSDAVRTRLFHLSIEGNGGPGLFTGHTFELGHISISDNDGPGAILGDEYSFVGRGDWTAILGSGTRITNNAGEGVYVAIGAVNVPYTSDLRVSGNAGAGILAVAGDVLLADSNSPPSGERIVVENNGLGGRCRTFHVPRDLRDVVEAEFPCMSGGIWTEENVRGTDTDVMNNRGDGIFAGGRVTLRDSRVCRNSGQQIVSENRVLSEVDLVCADLPDPDPGPGPGPDPTPMPTDDEGGCRCLSPGDPGPSWGIALLAGLGLLLGLRRSRRR